MLGLIWLLLLGFKHKEVIGSQYYCKMFYVNFPFSFNVIVTGRTLCATPRGVQLRYFYPIPISIALYAFTKLINTLTIAQHGWPMMNLDE